MADGTSMHDIKGGTPGERVQQGAAGVVVTWSVETARQYNVMISYLITHVDTIIQSDIEARLLNQHGNAV